MNRRIVIPEDACPPHEHDIDQSLHAAIAEALGERKVRFTDRRLLALYLITVLLLSFFLWRQHDSQQQSDQRQRQSDQRFAVLQRALHVNCDQEQFIVSKANAYYLAQIDAVNQRTDLKPADKDVLLRNYEAALFPSLRCDLLPAG